MSAQALRQSAKAVLQKKIDEFGNDLIDNTNAPLDQMRVSQGIVQGLRIALDAIDEGYKIMGE